MIILHDLVVIEPQEEENSALITPESSKSIPQEGTVIACGPEIESPGFVGSHVVYRKWTGDLVNIKGKNLVVVRFEDILLIIDKNDKKKNV